MSGAFVISTPYARTIAAEMSVDIGRADPSGPYGEVRARDVIQIAGRTRRATPLARRMMDSLGVDLSAVNGSGHDGRVRKADVLAFAGERACAGPGARPAANIGAPRRERRSGMRRIIGQRMFQAHTEIPSVTHIVKNDVTMLLEARSKLNAGKTKTFSVNDFVLKAVVKALLVHPHVLASLDGDEVIYHDCVNLAMAVALEGGLVVPVIRNAERLSFAELSGAARDLALRARENKLAPDEFKGNNFTVSNLGMFGVESFNPIINQPDAAIMGVCSISDELTLADGVVAPRKMMRTCLTYDHRLLDGATAAVFQLEVKRLLENPLEIVM